MRPRTLLAAALLVAPLVYRSLTASPSAALWPGVERSDELRPAGRVPPAGRSSAPSGNSSWMAESHLVLNGAARSLLREVDPAVTTLHFTFGSIVMLDFIHNWAFWVGRAGLSPALIGAADVATLDACSGEGLPAVGVSPELDVWTYARKARGWSDGAAFEVRSNWRYYRHHKSSFLEMGLVKVAFLWELLSAGVAPGFSVLISDLDVVWLNGHWARWMSHAYPADPACAEAALLALADVLVSTDEIDPAADAREGGLRAELNTGVLFLRATPGARAVVQAWRQAMLRVRAVDFVNDQTLFNEVVRRADLRPVLSDPGARDGWKATLRAQRRYREHAFRAVGASTRGVWLSTPPLPPCLAAPRCAGVRFSFGTLPMRAFTNGHAWFNQRIGEQPGADAPAAQPVTVHFTFQFGDTQDYPHGKRQRAREAALWSVDPPEYFSEGVFVRLLGEAYSPAQQAAVEARFPEWSPQRHMHLDAPQRAAVRDGLALAAAMGGILILPRLWCACDRYWNFLARCRYPHGPAGMALPFPCPMDALFDTVRWNRKGVRFREHSFLAHPSVPQALRANTVRVRVLAPGEAADASDTPREVTLPHGSALHLVRQAVLAANPAARLVELRVEDARRLCRWLGSRAKNAAFNRLARYVLTESSRYCPSEDHRPAPGPWDWRNPFTAYNCTWGFHHPAPYPEEFPCLSAAGVALDERTNSTTCPRQMLCGWNTDEDGDATGAVTFCNLEGYAGMDARHAGAARRLLAQMPGGRCPYPPGDRPGGGPGFDARGHWVGLS